MRIGPDLHLTYSPGADSADNWAALFTDVRHCALRLKERLAPHEPFGLGLRLSARAANELLAGKTLAAFADFLRDHQLYVFTVSRAREDIGQKRADPRANVGDWHDEACVQYTLRLITILKALLPPGVEGSISTLARARLPQALREDKRAYTRMSENLARVAMALFEVQRREDKLVHLDLESGPDSLVENAAATIAFYDRLLLPVATTYLAKATGWTRATAERVLRTHIRICVDSGRASANFETPTHCVHRLTQAGIGIGKLHVGAALKARFDNNATPPDQREWRVDTRVPLFVERVGEFASTRDETHGLLQALTRAPFTHQVEIETDNRDILPIALKQEARSSIEREYRWVMEALHQRNGETSHA